VVVLDPRHVVDRQARVAGFDQVRDPLGAHARGVRDAGVERPAVDDRLVQRIVVECRADRIGVRGRDVALLRIDHVRDVARRHPAFHSALPSPGNTKNGASPGRVRGRIPRVRRRCAPRYERIRRPADVAPVDEIIVQSGCRT